MMEERASWFLPYRPTTKGISQLMRWGCRTSKTIIRPPQSWILWMSWPFKASTNQAPSTCPKKKQTSQLIQDLNTTRTTRVKSFYPTKEKRSKVSNTTAWVLKRQNRSRTRWCKDYKTKANKSVLLKIKAAWIAKERSRLALNNRKWLILSALIESALQTTLEEQISPAISLQKTTDRS